MAENAMTAEGLLVEMEKLFISNPTLPSTTISKQVGLGHQKVVGLIKSISAAGDYITTVERPEVNLELVPEGLQIAANGSHEFVFWSHIPDDGIAQGDAMKIPNAKIGMGKALAAKWIKKEKSDGKIYKVVTDAPGKINLFPIVVSN